MEQQANIVADWYSVKFKGFVAPRTSATADTNNDRYIRENILMGQAWASRTGKKEALSPITAICIHPSPRSNLLMYH
jgi:hypothetical protein